MVEDLGVEDGLVVLAAVGDGGKGVGQLEVDDTVGQTAQAESLSVVAGLQGRDAQGCGVLVAKASANLGQGLDSDDIDRVGDGCAEVGLAAVFGVVVGELGAVGVGHGGVVMDCGKGHAAGLQGCRVAGDNLEAGAGLTSDACGTV